MTTQSIHLLDFPKVEKQAINTDLSNDMKEVKTIVSLGLSWRARKKIRVRQPLQTITIGITLDDHFQEIIRDELNIKQVIINPNINNKVTKICKPNAKILGPKYGKDIQKIIQKGKSGDFEEKEEGTIKIDHWILQVGEYEFDYIQQDDNLDIQVLDSIVIAIDPEITPVLEAEGYVRDLVRAIQEARKEAGYNIEDRIALSVQSGKLKLEESFADYLQEETLSSLSPELANYDLEKQITLA
ncbi:MAG: hypothetical protein GXP45_02190 [bacterium]|nr:hypothetical protein [bacterium]